MNSSLVVMRPEPCCRSQLALLWMSLPRLGATEGQARAVLRSTANATSLKLLQGLFETDFKENTPSLSVQS